MNSSNFLGRKVNVRNPATPYTAGKIIDSSKNYSNRIERKTEKTTTTKNLLSIRRKVFDVENTLKAIFNLDKKSNETKKRIKLVEVQEDRDRKKINANQSGLGNIIQRPKTGAMDFITNFLTFTFLGWLFTMFQPLIGKLEGLLPLLTGAFDFFGGVVKFLLNGFASFVTFGYNTYDKIKGAKDEVQKASSNIKKTFDDTTDALSKLINSTTEVANSFLNVFDQKFQPQSVAQNKEDSDNVVNFASLASSLTPTITPYATGGGINEGRIDVKSPITRGIEEKKKIDKKQKPTIQEQKTVPGKDVGGLEKIKELYEVKKSKGILDFVLPTSKLDKKSGYSALLKTSEEYKKPNSNDFLGLGNLMGSAVDVSLGQKPDRKTYTQFAEGLNYIINYGLNEPEEFKKLDLVKIIENIVQSKVELAINRIREEINRKTEELDDGGPGPDGGGGGIAGGEYGAYAPTGIQKEIYDYLINKKGLSDNHALGLMANISRESSFIPNNREPGGTGVGLFQWSHGRVDPFIKAVPDWETNWKGQIDYALSEPKNLSLVTPGVYQAREFKSAEEAADWWMENWERPRNKSGAKIKNANYLKSVPKAPEGSAKFREGSTPENLSVEGGILPSTRFISSYRGWRWGKMHKGVDYSGDGVNDKMVSVIKPGKVVAAGFDPGGGGYIVVIQHNDGTMSKYFHLKKGSIKVKNNQNITTGQVIGIVGNTGRSTGKHLHFEVWKGKKDLDNPHLLADNYFRFGGNVKPTEVKTNPKSIPGKSSIAQNKTPKGEAYMINGKIYYVDITGQGTVTSESGAKIDFSGGKNKNLLKEILELRELKGNSSTPKKKYGGLVYSRGSNPILPPNKYASYDNPTKGTRILIQPVITTQVIPAASQSNSSIIFSVPDVNSSTNKQELMRS